MILLETSYLVDYEKGRESARSFYHDHEYESVAASTFSMFELAVGIVWDGTGELDTLQESLMWVEFLPVTIESVRQSG